MMKRLAIITSHPIQYNAPLFKLLAQRKNIVPKVFYTWGQLKNESKFDPGFGKKVEWDIPLLEGYDYKFAENTAKDAGTHHFKGIDNPSLINEVSTWQPDAILVFGWSFKSHLKSLRYFHKKIPVFFRGDSTLLIKQGTVRKFIRTLFLKWVYSHVDKALYVGAQNKLYYLQHGLKENQLIFAPHAIDNFRFFDNHGTYTAKAVEWRKKLNIGLNDLIFLFAGKLEDVKNPAFLIQAFKDIQANGVHLVIVGYGNLEEGLKKQYGEVPNLHFVDFQNQSQMPVVYRLGDVFVLPSKSETWGLAVNEAMACGKPVIVSDKCGCAVDLVKEGINGSIFQAGDIKSLINAFNYFKNNRVNLLSMGEQSLGIIKDWNYEEVCKQLEKLLSSSGDILIN